MYSPAAIENAPAASPARPGEETALWSSLRAAGDAGDQGEVGDQPVHRAEDGRAQPAAGDVGVLVLDAHASRSALPGPARVRLRVAVMDVSLVGSWRLGRRRRCGDCSSPVDLGPPARPVGRCASAPPASQPGRSRALTTM